MLYYTKTLLHKFTYNSISTHSLSTCEHIFSVQCMLLHSFRGFLPCFIPYTYICFLLTSTPYLNIMNSAIDSYFNLGSTLNRLSIFFFFHNPCRGHLTVPSAPNTSMLIFVLLDFKCHIIRVNTSVNILSTPLPTHFTQILCLSFLFLTISKPSWITYSLSASLKMSTDPNNIP